jgi:hypothetical protein
MPRQYYPLDVMALITLGEQNKLHTRYCNAIHSPVTHSPWAPNIFPSTVLQLGVPLTSVGRATEFGKQSNCLEHGTTRASAPSQFHFPEAVVRTSAVPPNQSATSRGPVPPGRCRTLLWSCTSV